MLKVPDGLLLMGVIAAHWRCAWRNHIKVFSHESEEPIGIARIY
jgi:hypothetical protein